MFYQLLGILYECGNKVSVSINSFCLPHRPLSEKDTQIQNKREESHATFVSICRFFRFRDFLRTDAKLDRTHYCDKSWLSYHNYILLYVTAASSLAPSRGGGQRWYYCEQPRTWIWSGGLLDGGKPNFLHIHGSFHLFKTIKFCSFLLLFFPHYLVES